jgi:hypothetical protein
MNDTAHAVSASIRAVVRNGGGQDSNRYEAVNIARSAGTFLGG